METAVSFEEAVTAFGDLLSITVGVETIAEAAQPNMMTLYRYFDSKEPRADVSG